MSSDSAPLDVTPPAWWIYRGTGRPLDGELRLPDPPPWRSFTGTLPDDDDEADLISAESGVAQAASSARRLGRHRQAMTYRADDQEVNLVNLALYLRRPLLVTGQPGVGKSTLVYSVAYELKLGPVLRWPITSRSTLLDGLYQYDAVGRLQEVSLQREAARAPDPEPAGPTEPKAPVDIGAYVRLGPLGTALLPRRKPRAVLIDEIDKSDIDLPNDLLNLFEEGEFVIPELARLRQTEVEVKTADFGGTAKLLGGRVRCHDFPFVVLTSNNERDFPQPFLRRCIRLEIAPPGKAKLARMVAAHLEPTTEKEAKMREELIADFLKKQQEDGAVLANDQLLNALQMAAAGLWSDDDGRRLIDAHILRPLDQS
jgi:MoxR-like ATPase